MCAVCLGALGSWLGGWVWVAFFPLVVEGIADLFFGLKRGERGCKMTNACTDGNLPPKTTKIAIHKKNKKN